MTPMTDIRVEDRSSDGFTAALGTGRGTGAPAEPPPAVPAPGQAFIPEDIEAIRSPQELAALAERFALRPDWHEPDEQNISARIVGTHLDNAMGPAFIAGKAEAELAQPQYEFCVVIERDGEPVAAVNLATLLSWGAQAARPPRSPGAPAGPCPDCSGTGAPTGPAGASVCVTCNGRGVV